MQNFERHNSNTNLESSKAKNFKDINSCNLFLLSSIIASLNVLYCTNYTISMAVIVVELAILTYYFIKKDITKYLGYYLIFLCLSFEFDVLVGTEQFYGFKNFRILGINLGIIALLPVLALAISRNIKIRKIKREYPRLYRFSSIIVFLSVTGFMFGLFQILINDNNIHNMDNMLSSFIGVSYIMIAIPLLMIVAFAYIISWEQEKLPLLEKYLMGILIGVVASMIVSLVTGNFGVYGGINTLLVSNVIRYIPFMLLFPFYRKYKSKVSVKILMVFGIVGAILSLLYNATGKMIILYCLVPLGVLGILWKRKKILLLTFGLMLIPLIGILALHSIEVLSSNSVLFKSKLNQTTGLLKFWEANWIQNMPLSPRVRIIEFISIFYEYFTKPWFLIFGKGYMGTITDHTGMLTAARFISGSYSMNQWTNGTFYGVHETLNILFLYNGLVGLLFYFYMIKVVFTNFTINPWILIGGFWFLMAYGFSVTMSAFGLTALLVGYIDLDKEKGVQK